jgi:hypothetical protein
MPFGPGAAAQDPSALPDSASTSTSAFTSDHDQMSPNYDELIYNVLFQILSLGRRVLTSINDARHRRREVKVKPNGLVSAGMHQQHSTQRRGSVLTAAGGNGAGSLRCWRIMTRKTG